ncbi:PAS domain-containing protein [Rhodococcus opacus]|uniref:PAS domain-containing protein n=1 Tax=Rhodococcus opacus (strain B4) TaxID=632772 RepID=C1B6Y0_RHOOB|nr:PAS domain-containing protein [Rhodococcus opacus]BAH51433.1 hypothetical protein ROP_31860 [Rhodococcus opacus B4]
MDKHPTPTLTGLEPDGAADATPPIPPQGIESGAPPAVILADDVAPAPLHCVESAPSRTEVLDALFTVFPLPLTVHDDRRRVLFTNPTYSALLGYPLDELAGECDWLLLPSDTPRWRRFVRETLHSRGSRSTYFRLRHRGGDWLWVHARGSAFTAGTTDLLTVVWKDCSNEICDDPRALSPQL